MRYVRALDGVRGLAVGLVILFHYGFLTAGWVGVQLFFVLSGYLITGILVDQRELPLGRYLGRFYWRRAVRIFPLYFLFVALLGISYALLHRPATFRYEWPYLLTYTANFARALPADLGGYTVHLWSLAVEEQFYFLWPLLVFILSQRAFKGLILALVALVPLLRFGLFHYLAAGHELSYAGRLTYVLPATQFDAFATGAAVAVWRLRDMRFAGRWFLGALFVTGLAGFVMLLWAHVWGPGADVRCFGYPMFLMAHHQYVWGYSLLNVLSGLGIVCVVQGLPAVRWLEWKPLVELGKISYGVYIYHLPLLALVTDLAEQAGLPWWTSLRNLAFVPYVVLVLVIARLSFTHFERPFLNLKDGWASRERSPVVPDTAAEG